MTLTRKTPMKRSSFRRKPKQSKTRKRKTDRRKLMDACDDACALWVKEAHDWTCCKCGRAFGGRNASAHWSHIHSRRHKSIRWDPTNSVLHCAGCHRWYHECPPESGYWVVHKWLGTGRAELLMERKAQTKKWTETELRALLEHIKEDRARIAKLRAAGVSGYIEPAPFD